MAKSVPVGRWTVGDPEQFTTSGVTRVTCPLWYQHPGLKKVVRAGSIHQDYAEVLKKILRRAT